MKKIIWFASDVMEHKLTKEDFLAENAMELERLTMLSIKSSLKCLKKKLKLILLKLSKDS